MIEFYKSNKHNICVIDSDMCNQDTLDSIDFDSVKIGDVLRTKDGLAFGNVIHVNENYVTINGEEYNADL